MSKYKVEIEIDVDFEAIFAKIPEGLFEKSGVDQYYEIECIGGVLRDAYTKQLMKSISNLTSEHAAYHKHHDECCCAVGEQIVKNAKITKIE